MSLNKWVGEGMLHYNPERKKTTNGYEYAQFSIPLYREFPRKNKKNAWVQCEVWNNQKRDYVLNHLKSGDHVTVTGELDIDGWEEEGKKRKRPYIRVETVCKIQGQNKTELEKLEEIMIEDVDIEEEEENFKINFDKTE